MLKGGQSYSEFLHLQVLTKIFSYPKNEKRQINYHKNSKRKRTVFIGKYFDLPKKLKKLKATLST